MSANPYRDQFPILADRAYLATTSLGPLSLRSERLIGRYLDLWRRCGPDELWHEFGQPLLNRCRSLFAAVLGASAGEVALMPSASVALSAVASCIDFTRRPKVVLGELDFLMNRAVWQAQRGRGAELDVVGSRDGVRVDAADLVRAIDGRTAVVNVNRVLAESSAVVDLVPVVRRAREVGAWVVVDDYQGTGVVPIDVRVLDADFLVTGSIKWLCGGPGVAVLYCRRELLDQVRPLVTGWQGVLANGLPRPDGGRFETGSYPLQDLAAAVGGLELVTEVGLDRIRAANLALTRLVIDAADVLSLPVRTPRTDAERGGGVLVGFPGVAAAERALAALLAADVVVDRRGDALRIAPHFFNDAEDITRCFDVLARQQFAAGQ